MSSQSWRLTQLVAVMGIIGGAVLLMQRCSRSIKVSSISSVQPGPASENVHDPSKKMRVEEPDARQSMSPKVIAQGEDVDPKDQKVRPHPDSPARTDILRARISFEKVDTALSAGDTGGARRLLVELEQSDLDRSRWEDRLQGYELLIDCALKSDAETRAAAQEFLVSFPASSLRRKVRSECLSSKEVRR